MDNLTFDKGFKSGFITVVGQPNVGKSTLVNKLIGEKINIISRKAQTTRNRIQCILTLDKAQMIFIDTPGIHRPKDKMGKYLNEIAYESLREIDLVLFMVDANYKPNDQDKKIATQLAHASSKPTLLVLNKVDTVSKNDLATRINDYQKLGEFTDIITISAQKGINLDDLTEIIVDYLPEGPKYYPDDMITDQIEQFIVSELIREKILKFTHQEVPHSVAVEVTRFKERSDKDIIEIGANIYVERKSQKGILIGKGGSMLKKIGKSARADIENLLSTQVFLDLWVKIKDDWRDKEDALKMLGYKG